MFHLKAIELISKNLRAAYAEAKPGVPGAGREGMALGQYVAGMGFSNVGLGIDYAMAYTLSAHYDTPHGAACAMLLTVVDISGMSAQEAADAAIDAVRKLPADVEIPHTCNGLVAEDLEQLATDAMADACFPGNPRKSITIRQSSYSVNHGTLILI